MPRNSAIASQKHSYLFASVQISPAQQLQKPNQSATLSVHNQPKKMSYQSIMNEHKNNNNHHKPPCNFTPLCPPSQPRRQMAIERFTSHRHFQLVEGILHDVVGVELVHFAHHGVDIGHQRIRKQQEFGPREGLEAGETETVGFEDLDPRLGQGRVRERPAGLGGGRCA
ncbi:hypothetical protein VTN96DRAFT_9185 [Rasamsonia emersonii]